MLLMAWKGAWISYHVPSLKQAHTDVNMLLRLDEIVGRSINVLPLSEKHLSAYWQQSLSQLLS